MRGSCGLSRLGIADHKAAIRLSFTGTVLLACREAKSPLASWATAGEAPSAVNAQVRIIDWF